MKLVSNLSILLCSFVLVNSVLAQSAKLTSDLDPSAFSEAMAKEGVQLVDVRTPAEFAAGHLAGSVNIDWTAENYEDNFAKLDKGKPVLLYCHSGGRSEQALEYLIEKGYQAKHLAGGYSAWKRAGLSTVK